jgi:hypothetical protein
MIHLGCGNARCQASADTDGRAARARLLQSSQSWIDFLRKPALPVAERRRNDALVLFGRWWFQVNRRASDHQGKPDIFEQFNLQAAADRRKSSVSRRKASKADVLVRGS